MPPPVPSRHHDLERIRLLISDVDGTLLTPDKQITPAAIDAARRVQAAGIVLAITSSRPPRGLRAVHEALGLQTPIAGFNGGRIVTLEGRIIEERLLPRGATHRAVALIEAHGVDAWLFADDDWLLKNPAGPYVPREQRTVGFDPLVVEDFSGFYDRTAKVVGVSDDFDLLARCEVELKAVLGSEAAASRSQLYYLDVTHPEATKGTVVRSFSRLFGVPSAEIAVIGDMENDVAMFVEAGIAIAMGNASPEVRSAADFVTDSNSEDGFAHAIDRFVLPLAPTE